MPSTVPPPPRVSALPPLPLRVSAPPPIPALDSPPYAVAASAVTASASTPADAPVELTMSVNTMRVALKGPITDGSPFIVEPLKTGQPLPIGTMEAMLVLTGEIASGKTIGTHASWEYRIIEAWVGRCRTMIDRHGKRALRFLRLGKS
jgi:hypothetical protein